MRRINDAISADAINEYLRIRAEQYIEKKKKGITKGAEIEFYSNIMEIMSIIDYAGITLTINNSQLMKKVRDIHWNNYKGTI